jgi:hypothetical protein
MIYAALFSLVVGCIFLFIGLREMLKGDDK